MRSDGIQILQFCLSNVNLFFHHLLLLSFLKPYGHLDQTPASSRNPAGKNKIVSLWAPIQMASFSFEQLDP